MDLIREIETNRYKEKPRNARVFVFIFSSGIRRQRLGLSTTIWPPEAFLRYCKASVALISV